MEDAMRISVTTRVLAWVCLLAPIGAQSAVAAAVSITGGFTSYDGSVGGCGQYVSTINGQNVTPATGCNSSFEKALQMTFPATQSVEFSERQFFETSDKVHNLVSFSPSAPQQVAAVGDRFLWGTVTFAN